MTTSIPISVLLLTKNEELALPRTLAALRHFDQVYVVDSHSDDRTCQIATEFGAELAQFTWNGQYPKKKEWALLNLPLRNDWVLYLDADEVVSPSLAEEMRLAASDISNRAAAYDVELDYFFLGKRLKHGHRVTKRILVRQHKTSWPTVEDLDVANMWEVEGHYQPIVNGPIGRLTATLTHDDLDPLFGYFSRHNRYSDWEAHLAVRKELSDQVRASRSTRGRRYANLPLKPLAFLVYSYIFKRGFLDGSAGFHYAVAHSFYFWQIAVKKKELQSLMVSSSQHRIGA